MLLANGGDRPGLKGALKMLEKDSSDAGYIYLYELPLTADGLLMLCRHSGSR